jgi:hypothetical protein
MGGLSSLSEHEDDDSREGKNFGGCPISSDNNLEDTADFKKLPEEHLPVLKG